jgi:hypothetical protein
MKIMILCSEKRRWIVVQFYKFDFVLIRQKLPFLLVEKRQEQQPLRKSGEEKKSRCQFGVVNGDTMAQFMKGLNEEVDFGTIHDWESASCIHLLCYWEGENTSQS